MGERNYEYKCMQYLQGLLQRKIKKTRKLHLCALLYTWSKTTPLGGVRESIQSSPKSVNISSGKLILTSFFVSRQSQPIHPSWRNLLSAAVSFLWIISHLRAPLILASNRKKKAGVFNKKNSRQPPDQPNAGAYGEALIKKS